MGIDRAEVWSCIQQIVICLLEDTEDGRENARQWFLQLVDALQDAGLDVQIAQRKGGDA